MNWRALRADEFQACFLGASKVTLGPLASDLAFLFPLEGLEGRTLMTQGGGG